MFPWVYLGACALVAALGAVSFVGRFIRSGRSRRGVWLHVLAFVTLVPASLFTVQPYVSPDLVGAGDSYYYGLQVADFVSQTRAGVMPVLVGQSDYAFNGNINTVRTAPYFTHIAGLLDGLTGQRLSFVRLQNLTVTLTAILAAWAAYGSGLLLSGGRRIASWLIAFLYTSSPAVMGPLVLGDMFATYMAAPWQVLCWCGMVGILQQEDDTGPQVIAAGALAVIWYAHPPIAAWLSLIWIIVQVVKLGVAGGARGHWGRQALTAAVFLGLGAYALTNLVSIDYGPMTPTERPAREYDLASLSDALQAQFVPAMLQAKAPGIQLGLSLWLALFVSAFAMIRSRRMAGYVFTALVILVTVLLIPSPLGELAWRLVPTQLAAQTTWPAQRLVPLLASGCVALVALALRYATQRTPTAYARFCVLLGLGCAWSAAEASFLNRRPNLAKSPPEAQAIQFNPDNLVLTRYSYVFAAKLPPYFTHGWTDPEFETRILNLDLDPALDNATAILAAAGTAVSIPLSPTHELDLTGPGEFLLRFGFQDPAAKGELGIRGPGLHRNYTLPQSGESRAFGSLPAGSKVIPYRLRQQGDHRISVTATVPGVSLQVLPVNRPDLPIRLSGQTPFTIKVRAPEAGFVETPKVFLDGYAATVNGVPTDVRHSPNGLAMIPVPAGESEVVVQYRGTRLVRAGWYVSLASLAIFPWLLLRGWSTLVSVRDGVGGAAGWMDHSNLAAGLAGLWARQRLRLVVAVAGVALLVTGIVVGHQAWRTYSAYGPLNLVIELPRQSSAQAEPLLTVGKTGAADCIYVVYEDNHHIRLGYDHWGYGGPLSEPIPVKYGQPLHLEISLRGLFPATRWLGRSDPKTASDDGRTLFQLTLDGRKVFHEWLPAHVAGPGEVAVGSNPVGSSVAGPRFTGRIIAVERQPHATPRTAR